MKTCLNRPAACVAAVIFGVATSLFAGCASNSQAQKAPAPQKFQIGVLTTGNQGAGSTTTNAPQPVAHARYR